MTHNEPRSNALKDGAIGLSTGLLYGATSVLVGHPFDTIKTKMHAQRGFADSHLSMTNSFRNVYRSSGVAGLYRGWWPPLWGSSLYRSTQFAVYEALYTYLASYQELRKAPVLGIEYRVMLAAVSASTARAIIECPIELAKVLRQTEQPIRFRNLYKGFLYQWGRTSGVMVTYFICIDGLRRKRPETFQTVWGQFLASSMSATLGFWLVWPLEVMKNQVQANTNLERLRENASFIERAKFLMETHGGIRGLYRGIVPGTIRSFMSNGASMVVMLWANRKITEMGWR